MVQVTEQLYAIMSPDMISGIGESFPSIRLSKAYMPESVNVFPRYGEIYRMRGRRPNLLDGNGDKVCAPDGNPVIKYHRHTAVAGEDYFFGLTKRHIYLWSQNTTSWGLRFTASADTEHWSIISFNKKVIATNGIDLVQIWDEESPGTSFADLGSASGLDLDGGTTYLTKAKYVYNYENYVFLAYTQEGGSTFAFRIRWCDIGSETGWDETAGGDTGGKDFYSGDASGHDFVKGFGQKGTEYKYLVVFKDRSIYRGWLVTEDTVFSWAPVNVKVGLLATDSVVEDEQHNTYFLANDFTIREITKGVISKNIDKTLKQIHPTLAAHSRATFINNLDLIEFSVPVGNDATENNTVLCYRPGDEPSWSISDFPICAFGDYAHQTTYTIDTIPFSTIDTIGWAEIDAVENVVGFPIDIGSDYSGYTYALHSDQNDNDSAYTGSLVLASDMANKVGLFMFKRISKIQLYFRSEGSGEAMVEVKRDNEANWQTVGTVSLTGTDGIIRPQLYTSIRGRDFLWRISATNMFRFIGLLFTWEPDGDR